MNEVQCKFGKPRIRVLLIEDNPGDAVLVKKYLSETQIELEHYETLKEGVEALELGGFDVALVDFGLPDSDGLETLAAVAKVDSTLPIVVLTGNTDERVAFGAAQLQAQDFISKSDLNQRTIVRTIQYSLERKHAELKYRVLADELEEKKQALEEINRELEMFAYVAAHDLKAPVRQITNCLSFIGEDSSNHLTPQSVEWIAKTQEIGTRMTTLVDALLEYARIGNQNMNYCSVPLAEIWGEAVRDFEYDIKTINGEIRILEMPMIECDRVQMYRVFSNLLSNAIKFRRAGVGLEIVVSSTRIVGASHRYQLQVEDNGVGFDSSYRNKIFEPFERLKNEVVREGSGIGLATVAKIVQRHGGQISAESSVGVGSTFILDLPASQKRKER